MARLELKNISKIYQNTTKKTKAVCAVNDVSFIAEDGDFITLLGPSGCGKTTLLRMIAGLESITSGELLMDGVFSNKLEPRLRGIGMVFQEYALYPHLSVFENIAFPLKSKKYKDKTAIKARVNELADILELTDLLARKPKELSGGQRQRVAVGRAIVTEPNYFLFDEPLSNLDAKLRVQMRQELVNLQRKLGITTIYVTHDQIEAMTMGTKIAVLNKGVLQQFATPNEIYEKPANIFVADFIGSPSINLLTHNLFDLPNRVLSKQPTTIGIRPEHIHTNALANSPQKGEMIRFNAKVENIEFLGNEYIVYANYNNMQIRVRTASPNELKISEQVHFAFNIEDLILFDKNDERIK